VFSVWEPILPTDFSKPMSIVLNRISDPRVMQFWDEKHVLASQMAKDAREPQPVQGCCVRNNHLWDLVAVYRPGITWDDVMPTAVVFDGPVLYVKKEIVRGIGMK
jgi:hypothetical protein